MLRDTVPADGAKVSASTGITKWRPRIVTGPAIVQIHKSYNTPVPYPTMHQSEQKVYISVLNDALWDMGEVYCSICDIGLLKSSYTS